MLLRSDERDVCDEEGDKDRDECEREDFVVVVVALDE